MSKKSTTEIFIEKANEVHANKYGYSKVKYISNKTPVIIDCKIHGEFLQRPYKHLKGQGCPLCSKTKKNTTTSFIEKAKEVHGDKYDYSKVDYVNNRTKVCIICGKHGEFFQDPHNHLRGKGCPECANKKPKKFSDKTFIEESIKIHGKTYDYSKVNYIDMNTKVCIVCPIHGEFLQTPYSHINGCGCKKCSDTKNGFLKRKNTNEFIQKAKEVHGNKYDYSETEYKTAKNKVKIICPLHGEFYQSPWRHLTGSGCPKCVHHVSKNENEIFEYIKSLSNTTIIQNERKIISPKEIDIYIPDLKIGIEYNGIYWHSKNTTDKNQHLKKLELAKSKGIKLIQVFEDEYVNSKEIVLSKIRHLLGVEKQLPKIMGRKCKVSEISNSEAKEFLDKFHIQGYGTSTLHLGAFYEGELIAVMSFKKERTDSKTWELTRFASDYNYICQGVGGKLFKHFVVNNEPDTIKSFADRRWTVDEKGNIYVKLGFDFDGYTTPDYKYFNPSDGIKRQHKFGFRKQKLSRKYNLPLSMTENEMTEKLGYKKIYDCGLIRYVWKKRKD